VGRPVGEDDERQATVAHGVAQALGLDGVTLDVKPSERHQVAGQELPEPVRFGRPAVSDQPDPVERRVESRLPVVEQLVENRIEALLRRIPRLEDVLVEVDLVDRLDRGVGVGVRGQQDGAGVGVQSPRPGQQLGSAQRGHALVGHDQRHRILRQGKLLERAQRGQAVRCRQDAELGGIPAAQITDDRGEHRPVVVDRQDRRLGPGGGSRRVDCRLPTL
jgi:hypothetical protein